MIDELDRIGVLQHTDKACLEHDYLRHYDEIFSRYRDKEITLVEVGVAFGSSLRMWERYFPKATIVGIDIDPRCQNHAGGRRIVEIGSQADAEFVRSIGNKYRPNIVIDDGSHRADHIQCTFEAMYPFVEPGGYYVVEDIMNHSAVGSSIRGEAQIDSPEYFQKIAITCLLDHLSAHEQSPLTQFVKKSTDSVSFIRRAVILRKKVSIQEILAQIPNLVTLVDESKSLWNWVYLSNFILRNGGAPEEAERAARRAIEMSPAGPWQFFRLSEALEQKGDIAGAIEAMEQVIERAPQNVHWLGRLHRLRERV
jgi:hypothetical protein